jgi:hypothetical protein
MESADENKDKIYRRQQQLQAGEMSYYPGRDEWLKEWGNERRYGLPTPQMHDRYTCFLQGERNAEWVRGEGEAKEKAKIQEKIAFNK